MQDQNTVSYDADRYAEAVNPGTERHYDGAAWTEQMHAITATATLPVEEAGVENGKMGAKSAPAGWYDDGSGRQRWWDGVQWTEQFRNDGAAEEQNQNDGPAEEQSQNDRPGEAEHDVCRLRGRRRWRSTA